MSAITAAEPKKLQMEVEFYTERNMIHKERGKEYCGAEERW